MFKNIIKDTSSSSRSSYAFFVNNYDKFKPIRKITTFFDSENFLITPYTVDGLHVHMVLENWNGEEMHINNMNCGYIGEGPRTTEDLLKYIGIDPKETESLIVYDGLQITFTKKGEVGEKIVRNDVFFGDLDRHGKHYFDKNHYSYIDISNRKIYIINPQLTNFKGVLRAVDIMKPREFEYFIGVDSPLENKFRFNNDFRMFRGNSVRYNYRKIKGANEVNLIIRGEMFDIICLVNKNDLMVFIQTVYSYIFKENLFISSAKGNNCTVLSISDNYFRLLYDWFLKLLHKKENNIHESIRIEVKDGEMNRWKISF